MRIGGYRVSWPTVGAGAGALALLAAGLLVALWLSRPATVVTPAPTGPVALTVRLLAAPRCQPPSPRPVCRRHPFAGALVHLAGSKTPLVADQAGRLSLLLQPGHYRLTVERHSVDLVVSEGQAAVTLAVPVAGR